MEQQRRSRLRQFRVNVGLILIFFSVLLLVFSAVITAGEYFGWPTPSWREIRSTFGVAPKSAQSTDGSARICFIDVGQADATLIEQDGEFCLIDAGGSDTAQSLCEYLKSAGVKRLKCVVMTHPHSDHIGGMPKILQGFSVDEYILPDFSKISIMPSEPDLTETLECLEKQKENGCTVVTAKEGLEVRVGGGTLKVLLAGISTTDENDLSVCTEFISGSLSCIFTGDGDAAMESELVKTVPNLRADILKAGHHGSGGSNSLVLLKAIRPRYVVVSCGKDNDYGHPNASALARFAEVGSDVCRTDQNGSIIISSDGGTLTVTSEKQG